MRAQCRHTGRAAHCAGDDRCPRQPVTRPDDSGPTGRALVAIGDGVMERRGEDMTEGMDRLARSRRENAGRSPGETLDRIIADYTRSAHDDACLLAIQVN
ncbi:SpoIIE family protein phosphatase [Streptomyces sp. MS2.AVA.5]|uniref:SpoIIE family protein phosphatase n=1 Tax=Streptomyces achmelvichensis TaxID=3134111 RepID=A0ACC6PP82_9ACTN